MSFTYVHHKSITLLLKLHNITRNVLDMTVSVFNLGRNYAEQEDNQDINTNASANAVFEA